MKTKIIGILSVVVASWLMLALANSALAQMARGATEQAKQPTGTTNVAPQKATSGSSSKVATPITKEDAAKKYPAPKSGQYPMGERDPHHASGMVISPYPPRVEYDCSQINHGDLVLDTRVNKVFVRP